MHLIFWLYTVALLSSSASTSIALFVWSQHRRPAGGFLAGCLAGGFLVVLSLVLQQYAILNFGSLEYRFSVFSLLVLVAGCGTFMFAAPRFYHSVVGRTVGRPVRVFYRAFAAVFVLLALSVFLRPTTRLVLLVLNAMLFGMIGYGFVYLVCRYRRIGDRRLRRAILVVLLVSACFLPLLVLDAMLVRFALPPAVAAVEGTVLPSYLLVLNLLALWFAATYLNEPPYLVDGRISAHFRRIYDISAREAEIVRLLVDGKSTPEVAEALMIAASTVENHLFGVLRKVGVRDSRELVNLVLEHLGSTGRGVHEGSQT